MDFVDVIANTLNGWPVDGSFATVMPRHNWVAMDELWREGRQGQSGGEQYEFRVAYRLGDSTAWQGPGAVRSANFTSHTVKGTIPFVGVNFHVAYVEHELEVQRDNKAIIDSIKVRRQQETLGFYQEQEEKLFALPVTTGDNKTPHGIPYHCVPITGAQVTAGTGAGAFQGQHAAGFTSWCGIDTSTAAYSGLRNYNATWDGASASFTFTDENKRRLGRMLRMMHFQGPMNIADLKLPSYSRLKLMTDLYVIEQLEQAARDQNDNLGTDVLAYGRIKKGDAGVMVNGLVPTWCEELDTADTTNRGAHPLYCANFDVFKLAFRTGKFMKQRKPIVPDFQPDTVVEFVDSEINYFMDDRQKGLSVISYVAAV